jgi:hypothetical protein
MPYCTIEGCEKPMRAKGLCNVHYLRKRRHGNPAVYKDKDRDTPATV